MSNSRAAKQSHAGTAQHGLHVVPASDTSAPSRLVVAESNRMACELLADALARSSDRVHVVARPTRYLEVVTAIREQCPNVAVLNWKLEDGESSVRVLRQMQVDGIDCRAIVLLDNNERELIVDVFRAGAKGVFFRGQSFSLLRKAVRAVAGGQIWAGHTEIQYILDELLALAAPSRITGAKGNALLTEREEQVVLHVTKGLSNREISQEMQLSEHTVKNYLSRIFDKLGVSSRAELILYALHNQRQIPAHANATQFLS